MSQFQNRFRNSMDRLQVEFRESVQYLPERNNPDSAIDIENAIVGPERQEKVEKEYSWCREYRRSVIITTDPDAQSFSCVEDPVSTAQVIVDGVEYEIEDIGRNDVGTAELFLMRTGRMYVGSKEIHET